MAATAAAPPETWRLLARALGRLSNGESSAPSEPVDLSAVDGSALTPFALDHGVAPLLDLCLVRGSSTGVSEENRRALREAAHREAALDLALDHSLAGLWRMLAEQGFDALLLKGAALAHTVYPESRLRPRCDADLWVRREDAEDVIEALRTFGYALVNDDLATRSRKQFQATKDRFQGQPLWFDFHHRLSNRVHFMHALDFDECLDDAVPVGGFSPPGATGTSPPSITGASENSSTESSGNLDTGAFEQSSSGASHSSIPGFSAQPKNPGPSPSEEDPPGPLTLPQPHQLLHLCIHRTAHGRGSDRDRLIWLYDIHLLWGAMDTGERLRFTDLALDRGLGCLGAEALQTCQAAFGTTVSDRRLAALTRRRFREPVAKLLEAGKWRWAWADLQGQASLGDKLRFLGELARNRLP